MRKITFTILLLFFSVFASLAQDVSGWSGSGTASDPYRLATRADLELLATRVNAYNVSNGGTAASPMYRAYKGLYFKLTGNIDLLDSVFESIGNDARHAFAGTLDGDNHTIKRLNVSRSGYAGLFGNVDSAGVVRNLTLDDATVVSDQYFAGAAAAYCLGTLQNVHVTGSRVGCYAAAAGGLCGTASTVTGCSVEGTTVIGLGGFVGGIAGEIMGGRLENSHATSCTIDGGGLATLPVGGLVGNFYNGYASACYFTGTVDGSYPVNGTASTNLLVGGLFGRTVVSVVNKCFAKAQVHGLYSAAHVGGLVGEMRGGRLTASYSTGHVDCAASPYVGGLVGYVTLIKSSTRAYQPEVSNCYTAGTITCNTSQYDIETGMRELLGTVDTAATLTASNVYYDNQMANLGSRQHGVTTATLTAAAGPAGFSSSTWYYSAGSYPRLRGLHDSQAACYSASAIHLYGVNSLDNVARNAGFTALGNTKYALKTSGTCATISGDSLVLTGQYGNETLLMTNGTDTMEYALKIAPVSFDGEGTEASPYLIKTKDDMVTLSTLTTDRKMYFPGTYFKLAGDIDMEYTTDFKGICAIPTDVLARFAGTIDGDGHTLHHLALNNVKWTTEPTHHFGDGTGQPRTGTGGSTLYGGLVGRLDAAGVVKNLNIASDARIQFFAMSGAFVADNYGTVENCRNYADVMGLSNWIGGIVGRIEKGGVVRNCFNAGNVTSGYEYAGGVAGVCSGTVEGCMNTGRIEVRLLSRQSTLRFTVAGGIVGDANGMIMRNCLNTGTVHAASNTAGGLAGSLDKAGATAGDGNNDIYTSMSYGTVSAGDATQQGGIGGSSGTTGTISACWDSQIAPMRANGNADLKGATAMTTGQLTSGSALAGYDASVWNFAQGSYPTLQAFAAEPTAISSREVIVSIDPSQTASTITTDATLSAPSGTSWKLSVGTQFSISGNTLKVPVNPTQVLTDTLTATIGSYEKTIALVAPYALPLQGSGTQADPYQIHNASEWNTVAHYMNGCATDFDGKYLKVMNDIDFTDTTFVPMGYDKVNYLQGDFDGGGFTVRGIDYSPTTTAQGAFTVVGEHATVHDLTIEGTVTSAQGYTGGFAGTVNGTMRNCVSDIAVTGTRTGVAGFTASAGATAHFVDCYNRASVTGGAGTVGGFAASVLEGATFTRCGNEGAVTNQGTQNYTGGFTALSAPATYVDCYNTGEVVNEKSTSSLYAAGFIANATAGKGSTLSLTRCYNTANVTAKGNLAGLVSCSSSTKTVVKMDSCYNTGNVASGATSATSSAPTAGLQSYYAPGSTYSHCYNTGNVTSQTNLYASGLLGMRTSNATSASGAVTIDHCYNTGKVVAGAGSGAGIAVFTNSYTTIDHCYNTGSITGKNCLGGIITLMSGPGDKIVDSWNEGDITVDVNRAGGIQGYGLASGKIENCFNVGNIATTDTVPGTTVATSGYAIGGLAGATGATFTNCYNAGKVTGASMVGGLVGYPYKGRTSFYNCYNAGEIVADVDTCGAIIGCSPANGTLWSDANVVQNVYYATDYGTYANSVGAALSMRDLCRASLGDAFTSLGDYMLPVLTEFGTLPVASFYAAAVCVAPGDDYRNVTTNFNVGNPAGIKWSPSATAVTIDGTDARFTGHYDGALTLTATMGAYTKQVLINCVNATAIHSVDATEPGAVVVGRYNLQGAAVDAGYQGVQLLRYSDGTTRKVVVK